MAPAVRDDTSVPGAPPADPQTRLDVVRRCLSEALAVDIGRVQAQSNLVDDLGADSLAFLDIVFRIERAFQIQITRGEIEKTARGDMSEEDFAPSGIISERGLERLRTLMPEAADRIKVGLRPGDILGLFTTQTFVNMVERKLQGPARQG